MTVPTLTFHNGVDIPQLGFGVWQVSDDEAESAVSTAFEAGYRHIDTAAAYGNEQGVGRAIAASGLDRDELFITTKLWNNAQGYDNALKAFEESRARLGLDVVDLYLIHWPTPERDLYVETWKAFEKLYADGLVRAIGVSNFLPEHLDRLITEGTEVPVINQVELHPGFRNLATEQADAAHRILTEAWSPLGQGTLLEEPTLVELAEAKGRSVAQVIIRWHLQSGRVVIPKSVTPSRIRENIDVFDFSLTDEEMAAIEAFNTDTKIGPDPAAFNN
ncbi:aldo/keto reductase [Nocardioides sp. Kera G14]|uniref:aldo/keto reductase n=1 Tax=Nocardioides sp. Kera G14 TaxID=2884264 RepID=UPI001D11CEAA|nr:aldo/keto reductase [Nocardioides sp. Kera G14]UDY22766.1 aldo/keto reductase [Nocardioides sp. Kera G14]